MQKLKTRALSFVTAFLLVFTLLPMLPQGTFTASAETKSGKCGENATWEYDTQNQKLTISGSGAMYDYTGMGSLPWVDCYDGESLDNMCKVEKLVINEGITSIGNYSFQSFDSITELTIPSSVKTIGRYAFEGCNDLETLTFAPGSQLETLSSHAFSNCSSLASLNLPEGLKTIGNSAFMNSKGLKTLFIPSTVTTIEPYAFHYSKQADHVYCFASDPTTLGWQQATQDFDIHSFRENYGTVCHVPVGTKDNYQSALSFLNLTFKDDLMKCGDNAWCELKELEPEYGEPRYKLTIKGSGDMWDFSAEKYAPWRDVIAKIKEVVITKDITRIGKNAFSSYDQDIYEMSVLESVTFEENSKLDSIGDHSFYYCSQLKSITIPASVKTIEGAFYDSGLESVTFENNSKLEKIGKYAFYYCQLEEITLPASLKEIESYAFSRCYRLETINCLVADPSKLTLGDLSGDFINEPPMSTICFVPKGTLAAYETKFASGEETDPNVTFVVKPCTLTVDDDITGGTVTASKTTVPTVEKSFTLEKLGEGESDNTEQRITETVYAENSDTVKISLSATGGLPTYSINMLNEEDEPAGELLAEGKTASYTADVTYNNEDKTVLNYMIWGFNDETNEHSKRVILTVVINWTGSNNFYAGEQIKLTANPDDGYIFKNFIVQRSDETNIELDNNNCFTMPDIDVFASAVFEKQKFTVTVGNPTNGTLTADKTTNVPWGETVTVTPTANDGYVIKGVYLDNEQIAVNAQGKYQFVMPKKNVTVSAEFEKQKFTVTVENPSNGTLTADKTTNVPWGEAVTVTPAANNGYILKGVYLDNEQVAVNAQDKYQFVMPKKNVTVSAEFEKQKFTVTVGSPTNGTLTSDKTTNVPWGETVTVTPTANDGYVLKGVYLDNEQIAVNAQGKYQFVMPKKNVTVTAVFEKQKFTVTVQKPSNGTLSADKTNVAWGVTVTVTPTANSGYVLKGVYLDGNQIAVNAQGKYQFVMPKKNVTVTAEFEKQKFTVTVTKPSNGTLTSDKTTNVPWGETVTVTPTANDGYVLKGVYLDGNQIAANDNGKYQFVMPKKNVTVTAVFEKKQFKVTVVKPANGTLSADKTNVAWGVTVTVTPTANNGYVLKGVYLDGEQIVVNDKGKYQFVMPKKNVTVTAEFEKQKFTVTVTKPSNGTLTSDKTTNVPWGETVTVTPTANDGYVLKGVYLDGNQIAVKDNGKYQFVMPKKNVTVTAVFEKQKFTVTVENPTNGTLSADKTNVAWGVTVTVTPTANSGYVLKGVYLDGERIAINGNGKYQFVMPKKNVTVSAEFVKQKFTVTVTKPSNGTLTADKTTNVPWGETVTVTPTANDGYILIGVYLDGNQIAVNDNGKYQFVMPKKNVTVTAEFEKQKFTVTVQKPSNGTLSADKTNVAWGVTVTVTPTANSGYVLKGVYLDNEQIAVNAQGKYQFVMPKKNVTVTAEFEKQKFTVTVTKPSNGTLTSDKTTNVPWGETVTVTPTANDGYVLKGVYLDGNQIAVNDNGKYQFVMPKKNVTVTAVFEKKQFKVTVVKPANGTLTADKTNVAWGVTVTVTPTANSGYVLKGVYLDNEQIAVNDKGKYQFVMPKKNVKVSAVFEKIHTRIVRISGDDRYGTTAAISKKLYTKADTVILTYGYNYADALVGVPLAAKLNAPILLSSNDSVPSVTLAEIKRLGAKKVIILGGTYAISESVENQLKAMKLTTQRISGDTRFGTAAAIAEKLNKNPEEIFFVYGLDYADALSVNPIAALKKAPILYLSKDGDIDPDTAAYLAKIKGKVKKAYVIGGKNVISDEKMKKAVKACGLKTAQRIAGDDRYLTNIAVNEQFKDILKGKMICVATGNNFPDALAGGLFAAIYKAPLILVNTKTEKPTFNNKQTAFLKAKVIETIVVFGGTSAVPDAHVTGIAEIIK